MPKLITNKYMIVNAYNDKHNNHLTNKQIAKLYDISPKTIYNYINNPDLTDNVKRESFEHSPEIINFIINRAINNMHFNFKSMRKALNKEFNINIKKHQLYSILKKNNLTYKRANIKNTSINTKRSIDKIKNLHNKITTINGNNEDNIIFTDEAHIRFDDIKMYGWNLKNKEVTFIKDTPTKLINKRVSIIASVSRYKKIGYSIIYGSCDNIKYKRHVKKINKKVHKRYHYHDGAKIHETKLVLNSMKRMGIIGIKGVPYTPELNIIEYFFNVLKYKIKTTEFKDRLSLNKFINKCWNSIDNEYLSKTYNHVYSNIEFCNRCV